MNSEVSKILELFIAQEQKFGSLVHYLCETKFEKVFLMSSLISLFLGGISWFIKPAYSVFGLGLTLLFFAAYMLAGVFSSLSFICNAKRDVLLSIKVNNTQTQLLVSSLSNFQVSALKHVQLLFSKRVIFIKSRVGFLVGAIDKLGLFPALFMLYYTYTQLPKVESLNNMHIWVLSFTCGLYIGVVLLKSVIDSLEDNISILDLAIVEASEYKLP